MVYFCYLDLFFIFLFFCSQQNKKTIEIKLFPFRFGMGPEK